MLYLRCGFVAIWLGISFGIGFVRCFFQWGNLNLNRQTAILFAVPTLWVLGIRVEVENLEELEKHQPCIYLANHQGALDIATFGSLYPHRTIVIGKKEIGYIPILNLFFIAAGNVLLDRANRVKAVANLEKLVERVKRRKASIWIFGEGTRNKTEELMLPLKRGAFHMAVEAQMPIVPMVSCLIRDVQAEWKQGRMMRKTVRIRVLPPVLTKGLTSADIDRLTVEVREKMMEAVRGLSSSSSVT